MVFKFLSKIKSFPQPPLPMIFIKIIILLISIAQNGMQWVRLIQQNDTRNILLIVLSCNSKVIF